MRWYGFHHLFWRLTVVMVISSMTGLLAGAAVPVASITVQGDQPGVPISSNLFGIFFEEINSAGDGGLYAELVRNRSLEDASNPANWSLVTSGGATGTLTVDNSLPLSSTNSNALKLTQSGSGTAGAANTGFW